MLDTGIDNQSLQTIIGIITQYAPSCQIVIFGSRAKGNYREGSDIDIALKGATDLDAVANIKLDYDNAYLPWKLDVLIYDDINNQDLKDHIDRIGVILAS